MISTHIFLLFVDVTNLEPDILLRERSGRIVDDVFETLFFFFQTLAGSPGKTNVGDPIVPPDSG